jgi:hypothetical protein
MQMLQQGPCLAYRSIWWLRLTNAMCVHGKAACRLPTALHIYRHILACRRWEWEWVMGPANGFYRQQCKQQMRTHKTCSCIVTAGRRMWRSADKHEIDRFTFGACSAPAPTQIKAASGSSVVGSVWSWSRLCNFSLLKVCSVLNKNWEGREFSECGWVFRYVASSAPGEAEIEPMIDDTWTLFSFGFLLV